MMRSPFDLIFVNLTAARMTAVTGDFRHILAFRFLAVIAAISLIVADRTVTNIMPAFVIFVRHNLKTSPCSYDFSPTKVAF